MALAIGFGARDSKMKQSTFLPSSNHVLRLAMMLSLVAVWNVSEGQVEKASEPKEPTVEVAVVVPNLSVDSVGAVPPLLDESQPRILTGVDRDVVRARLDRLVNETKTAYWRARVTETLGDETEVSTIVTAWAGTELQKIKIKSGRGAGKTLLLKGDTVYSGWMRMRHTNSMVRTIRGNSLKLNGYLDDLQFILPDWNSVVVFREGDSLRLEFVASNAVDSKLWLDAETLIGKKFEAYKAGKLVGLYEYQGVIYNPNLPAKTWKR